MIAIKSENRRLLYLYYFIAGISMIYILVHGKSESFLKLYAYHSDFMNSIMKVVTYLGDEILALLFAGAFIFYRLKISFFLLINWFVSGLIAQVLKRYVFTEELRPLGFFRELGVEIYQIPGLDIHMHHSFPSGHTATAFAIFFGLALFMEKSWFKVVLIILAVLGGYSRIYLGQHFLTDVIAGSVIGVFTSILFFSLVESWKAPWLNKSIQSILIR